MFWLLQLNWTEGTDFQDRLAPICDMRVKAALRFVHLLDVNAVIVHNYTIGTYDTIKKLQVNNTDTYTKYTNFMQRWKFHWSDNNKK